jgi:hypothetical protein
MRTRAASTGRALADDEREELLRLLAAVPVGAWHKAQPVVAFVREWYRLHVPASTRMGSPDRVTATDASLARLRVTLSVPSTGTPRLILSSRRIPSLCGGSRLSWLSRSLGRCSSPNTALVGDFHRGGLHMELLSGCRRTSPERSLEAMSDEPAVEIDTTGEDARHRELNLNDLIEAEEMLASGKATADEVEAKFPGYESVSQQFRQSMDRFSETVGAALTGPAAGALATLSAAFAKTLPPPGHLQEAFKGINTQLPRMNALQEAFKGLNTQLPRMNALQESIEASRRRVSETIERANESSLRSRDLAMPPMKLGSIRSPVDATERVASEIRELAAIEAEMAENTRDSAEISRALLDQMAAFQLAMAGVHETIRQGLAAGQRNDTGNKLLTLALVILAVVVAVPVVRDLWSDAEPLRSLVWTWLLTR